MIPVNEINVSEPRRPPENEVAVGAPGERMGGGVAVEVSLDFNDSSDATLAAFAADEKLPELVSRNLARIAVIELPPERRQPSRSVQQRQHLDVCVSSCHGVFAAEETAFRYAAFFRYSSTSSEWPSGFTFSKT